ncbi:MAG: AarF/ABC1/UbiB kinase family protein, partial [Actinomycetota bacterium]|nr:AarF/ABC1/UbiB kinase family protein [Actinomycetota bacterium]
LRLTTLERQTRSRTSWAISTKWVGLSARVARLGAIVGGTHLGTAARKVFADAERRSELDTEKQIATAQHVTEELGQMKGALMKLGQMASYLDDALPEPLRAALATLQNSAPPMSAELASAVIAEELGAAPDQLFAEWDPTPIAAASIGQVHRAIIIDKATGEERAVAVKVQYPGVDTAIAADLRNANILGTILKQGFGGLNPAEMVEEIKDRLTEELDYRREAANQQRFADFYRGHPTISIPDVVPEFSSSRVLTTELISGHTWSEVLDWDQDERDAIAETMFRFVFRSLYRLRSFNGDPHPGNYIFHRDGKVTFIDFGLVKDFTVDEMATFETMVRLAAVEHDVPGFRTILEGAGMLQPDAPVDTTDVGTYFSRFYEPISQHRNITWTPEYASGIVRHTFDRSSPISQYASVPRAFVFIQRINLGLYALLGDLNATGNYRAIAEELWPFMQSPPSTPLGEAEEKWLKAHPAYTEK